MIKSILLSVWLTIIGGFPYPPHEKYDTDGQNVMFVLPSAVGSGNCTSWKNACKLETALGKTADNCQDVIYVGNGNHDVNNGTNPGGLTIDKSEVSIVSVIGTKGGPGIYNSHGSATHVFQVTGDKFFMKGIQVRGPTTGIGLEAIGGFYIGIQNSVFVNGPTDNRLGQGLKFSGGANAILLDNLLVGSSNIAVQFDNSFEAQLTNILFTEVGIGAQIVGSTLDRNITIRDSVFELCDTVAFDIVGNNVDKIKFYGNTMVTNADHVRDTSNNWGAVKIFNIEADSLVELVYPVNGGHILTSGSGPWVWTAAYDVVVPQGTITDHFLPFGINIQAIDAAPPNLTRAYKFDAAAGPDAATQSTVAIWEFTTGEKGTTPQKTFRDTSFREYFPPNTTLAARLMTQDTGTYTITYTVYYVAL